MEIIAYYRNGSQWKFYPNLENNVEGRYFINLLRAVHAQYLHIAMATPGYICIAFGMAHQIQNDIALISFHLMGMPFNVFFF